MFPTLAPSPLSLRGPRIRHLHIYRNTLSGFILERGLAGFPLSVGKKKAHEIYVAASNWAQKKEKKKKKNRPKDKEYVLERSFSFKLKH